LLTLSQHHLQCSKWNQIQRWFSQMENKKYIILTLQPCKLINSSLTQCCAKQLIARVVIFVQPLDIKDFSLGQPCASASTPI